MLPFSIINEYGNIAPQKPKILDIQGGANRTAFYILYTNGELYGYYDNFYGNLGQGDRTNRTDKFYLISTGVRLFAGGANGCAMIKNDNTIWHCGSRLQYSTVNDYNLVPTNITSSFAGVDLSTVTKMTQCDTSLHLLTSDGVVYGIGSNSYGQLGTGVKTAVSSAISIATGARDISSVMGTFAYTDVSNNFYGAGYNSNAQLANGNTTSSNSFILIASNVQYGMTSSVMTQVQYLDGSIKSAGFAGQGQLGTTTPTSGNVTTLTSINPMIPGLDISYNHKIKICSTAAAYGVSSGLLYSTGNYNGSSQNITSGSVYSYRSATSPIGVDFDGISVTSSSAWMWKGANLYYTGSQSYYLNTQQSVPVSVFTKITQGLPYY